MKKKLSQVAMKKLQLHIDILKESFDSLDKKSIIDAIDLDRFDLILRDHITIKDMRDAGSFFTGSALALESINSFNIPISKESKVLDPACGAGNLLIQISKTLPIYDNLLDTIKSWGKVLYGFDLHQQFVDAAKIRIILAALSRGCVKDCTLETAMSNLNNLHCQDALTINKESLNNITHIVMNPPFTIISPPSDNFWKDGKVNFAGVFLKKFIELSPAGCCFSFILPDVIRSGSRYNHLREFISNNVLGKIKIWGRFNVKTDVDVFILSGNKKENIKESIKWNNALHAEKTLSEKFDVRIGPLVAYRDPKEGELLPYLHPKNCFAWEIKNKADEYRNFLGKGIESPFIVVKRTSSPKDKFRASATLITIPGKVAVENHLIIIKPKNNSLEDCKKLLQILHSSDTNSFLNDMIRVRHLTVGVVKGIPIKDI